MFAFLTGTTLELIKRRLDDHVRRGIRERPRGRGSWSGGQGGQDLADTVSDALSLLLRHEHGHMVLRALDGLDEKDRDRVILCGVERLGSQGPPGSSVSSPSP